MPKVGVRNGIRFYIYSDDHPPPHVHAVTAEWILQIRIDNGEVLKGAAPAAVRRDVVDFVKLHRVGLLEAWYDVRERRKPRVFT
jgi:hypothetical protein